MTILLTIFLTLGIAYFIKKLTEPAKPAPRVIVELKMPEIQPVEPQPAPQPEEDYYGPVPTREERRVTLNRLVEFFKKFPESPLKDSYPQQANMARALIRYSELELLLQSGHITQETYDEEVEKLLPLIDISEDIPHSEK
jgi:hypothetical protein